MTKKLDLNDYSFAQLTLKLLLHYLVICRSWISAVWKLVKTVQLQRDAYMSLET